MKENKRLNSLLHKYAEGSISRVEYEELIQLTKTKNGEKGLDKFLDQYWIKAQAKAAHTDSKKWSYGSLGKIAATFVLLTVCGVLILLWMSEQDSNVMHSTAYGETREITLPDGSFVKLNANTSIEWDNSWKKNKLRKVSIKGEAYFNVLQTENKIPFIVQAGDLQVKVLGTSFNVLHRADKSDVFLEEGKVELVVEALKDSLITLIPGDKVEYIRQNKSIEKLSNETKAKSASWTNGVLNFKNLTFSEVLIQLKDIYGYSFVCEDASLRSKVLYLGVPYQNWEAVKGALELTLDIKFEEKEDYVLITAVK